MCWALTAAQRNHSLMRDVPCRRFAKRGKLLCMSHMAAESRAQEFKAQVEREKEAAE
jgi:hypothetical protein